MKDCVIVCGYPTNDDGSLSNILKSRIDKAIELYDHHQVRYFIVSGGAIHNQYSEALAMKAYALKKGVKDEDILLEEKAKSTYHNMKLSQVIMEQYHFHDCYIVTNSWHKIKAKYYAEKFHLNFEMVNANKPQGMSYFKVFILTLDMPLNMFINRLKGFK